MSFTASLHNDQCFCALIEHSPDVFALLTPQGSITYVSPSCERVTGYPPKGLVGMNSFTLVHPEDLETVLQQFSLLRNQPGHFLPIEYRMRHQNGTYRWMEGTATNLLHEPTIQAIVVNFRDTTQRKQNELKLRSLVESNILGVAVSDSSGHIHEANDRFAQLVGYSKEELLSGAATKDDLIPADYRQALMHHEEILLSTGAMPPWEKECLRKDGSRVPTLMAGALIDREQGLALVLFHDISDRKEVERRKQEFLCMVSHELRTPLTSIMGLIELALLRIEQRPTPLPSEAEGLISQIKRLLTSANMHTEIEARMVEELLEAARMETHTFDLSLQQENLVTIVQEVTANQQQVALKRQIELTLPPDEMIAVIADAGRIGQVLTNYLTNALKYAPDDQVISVRLAIVEGMARVSVRDQGPGLTLEQQRQVWKHFYQGATPRHWGPHGGLGLGLAIAKALIEQHQGQVGVASTPGQGSTFWFTLPLANDRSLQP
jgi:PAS domain S-box-containing protein